MSKDQVSIFGNEFLLLKNCISDHFIIFKVFWPLKKKIQWTI